MMPSDPKKPNREFDIDAIEKLIKENYAPVLAELREAAKTHQQSLLQKARETGKNAPPLPDMSPIYSNYTKNQQYRKGERSPSDLSPFDPGEHPHNVKDNGNKGHKRP
jgi:hypothetical protein